MKQHFLHPRLSRALQALLSILLLALLLPPFVALPPAGAQSAGLLRDLRQARAAEAKHDYSSAGMDYLSVLKNNCNGEATTGSADAALPKEFKAALGRRAVACLTLEARKKMDQAETPGDAMRCWVLGYLDQAYELMSKLEPDNPTWTYLMAAHECAAGHYAEASGHLQQCAGTTGGQASVRDKAAKLLTHISPYAGGQSKMSPADREAVQAILSGPAAAQPAATAETPQPAQSAAPEAKQAATAPDKSANESEPLK